LNDASPLRVEDARLLRGRARFTDDVHLDRMVHAVFVRSPMAHAKIGGIDAEPALAAGALAVITAKNLPFIDKKLILRYWNPNIRGGLPSLLAADRVRHVGEAVALVIAENRYVAEDIAVLVAVDYRPLPPVATTAAAVAAGAERLHEEWPDNIAAEIANTAGDADAAMAQAPRRLKRSFRFGRQTGLPLETRGCVAEFDTDRNRLTMWISTQVHYTVRNNLSEILGVPEYDVRVIAEDVGGGFGTKSRPYAEEIIVGHASRLLGRPVKWIEDRSENLQATTHSRATETTLEIGYDETGRVHALRGELVVDIGAYVFTSGIMTAEVASGQCAGPYKIANINLKTRCVGTNKTPLATYRGAGQPEATFPLESLLNLIARDVGISAAEVRIRNIVGPSDMPYAPSIPYAGPDVRFESGDYIAMIRRAESASGYHDRVEILPDGRKAAWGIACGIEATGLVGLESARVRIDPSGAVSVASGMTSQGQGQSTAYAQVCAEILGLPLAEVTVSLGDTGLLPFGVGAFASRGAVIGANAVAGAAEKMRDTILGHAGTLLQRPVSELTMAAGRILLPNGTETDLTFAGIARAVLPGGPLFSGDTALEEEFIYDSKGSVTFALSVHAAKVAVDIQSGDYRVVDYYILHDAGRMLNPMIVDGQVVGGAVDGMGCTMLSELLYNEDGQLISGTLADYLVMAATDAPTIRLDHVQTLPTTNPLGVRGVGEGAVLPVAPAIVGAITRIVDPRSVERENHLYAVPLKPTSILLAMGDR